MKTVDEFQKDWKAIKRKDKRVLIRGIWRSVRSYEIYRVPITQVVEVTFMEGPFRTVAYPLSEIERFE